MLSIIEHFQLSLGKAAGVSSSIKGVFNKMIGAQWIESGEGGRTKDFYR